MVHSKQSDIHSDGCGVRFPIAEISQGCHRFPLFCLKPFFYSGDCKLLVYFWDFFESTNKNVMSVGDLLMYMIHICIVTRVVYLERSGTSC